MNERQEMTEASNNTDDSMTLGMDQRMPGLDVDFSGPSLVHLFIILTCHHISQSPNFPLFPFVSRFLLYKTE